MGLESIWRICLVPMAHGWSVSQSMPIRFRMEMSSGLHLRLYSSCWGGRQRSRSRSRSEAILGLLVLFVVLIRGIHLCFHVGIRLVVWTVLRNWINVPCVNRILLIISKYSIHDHPNELVYCIYKSITLFSMLCVLLCN